MSAPELPPITEAVLDADTLAALFADLAAHTVVLDVLTKGSPGRRADAAPADLDAAAAALGQGRSVQIRYRWGGAEWMDTLMPAPGGARLVRLSRG